MDGARRRGRYRTGIDCRWAQMALDVSRAPERLPSSRRHLAGLLRGGRGAGAAARTRWQRHDCQGVEPGAASVVRVREPPVVRAGLKGADVEEGPPTGEPIHVDQRLLGTAKFHVPSEQHRVLAIGQETQAIEKGGDQDLLPRILDSRLHFVEDRALEWRESGQSPFRLGVLGFEERANGAVEGGGQPAAPSPEFRTVAGPPWGRLHAGGLYANSAIHAFARPRRSPMSLPSMLARSQ